MLGSTANAARSLNVTLRFFEVDVPTDFEKAFGTVVAARIDAVLLFEDPIMITNSVGRTAITVLESKRSMQIADRQ